MKAKTRALLDIAHRTREAIEGRASISGRRFRYTQPAAKKAKITKARRAIADQLRAARSDPSTEPGAVRAARRSGWPNL